MAGNPNKLVAAHPGNTNAVKSGIYSESGRVLAHRAQIAHAVWGIATDFASFWTLENLMRLLLPPALTIAFMPYAYSYGSMSDGSSAASIDDGEGAG